MKYRSLYPMEKNKRGYGKRDINLAFCSLIRIFACSYQKLKNEKIVCYFCADHRNDERISTVIVQNFG